MEIEFKNALIAYWNKTYMRNIESQLWKGMHHDGC